MRCLLFTTLVVSIFYSDASAISFGSEYVNIFDSCEIKNNNLSFCDDVINLFNYKMTSLGHTNIFTYANELSWSTDIVEDSFGGYDYYYADNVDMFTMCSHGYIGYTSIPIAPPLGNGSLCCTSYLHFCSWDGGQSSVYQYFVDYSQLVLGEAANWFWGGNASGKARYLMLHNCHSMYWLIAAWINQLFYGLDFAMGYVSYSMDNAYTAASGFDWATVAMGYTNIWDFKAAWFWATEDWSSPWYEVAVVTGGLDLGDAYNNLNNYYRTNPGPHTQIQPPEWWDFFVYATHGTN